MSTPKRYFSRDDQERGLTPAELKTLEISRQTDYIVYWFFTYYQDPVHETPYISAEGGYLYIHGGPYDALDEIQDEFGSIANEEAIELALNEIQSDGTIDWAPTTNHPDYAGEEDGYNSRPSADSSEIIEYSLRQLERDVELRFGDEEEIRLRSAIHSANTELFQLAGKILNAYGAIGHNNPPDSIFDDDFDLIRQLREESGHFDGELAKQAPNAKKIGRSALIFNSVLMIFRSKLAKFSDAFTTSLGDAAGKAVAVGASAIIFDLYPSIIKALSNVVSASAQWLHHIVSIF